MGMQISSQLMGDPVNLNRELPGAASAREKRPPLPGEQRFSPEQVEAQLKGSRQNTPTLEQTISNLEQISLAFNRRLQFVVDSDSKQVTVKVIDNETDKVIRVLPPEELQRVHSRIEETVGLLFDRKA